MIELARDIIGTQPILAVFLAIGRFNLFIEARPDLIAQQLALQHFLEELRQLQVRALVLHRLHEIANHARKHIEADQINGAKGGCLGPAAGAGQRINLFHGQIHLLHQAKNIQAGKSADAVGDEIRRVLGIDDAFAQAHIA